MRRFLPSSLVRRVQASLFALLGLRWTLGTGIALQLRSRTDWTLYNDIFVEREYDDAIEAMIDGMNGDEAALVVDLGANVGFFELRLFHLLHRAGVAARRLRVVAVEPSAANLRELRRSLESQGEWSGCLQIEPGLVGERRSGGASLFESHNYGMNTIVDSLKYRGARRTQAFYVDLDGLLPKEQPIQLLKCDIEGSELEFVRTYGELLRRVQLAVFEVHHAVCDVRQINLCLEEAGLSHERVIVDRGSTSVRLYSRGPSSRQ